MFSLLFSFAKIREVGPCLLQSPELGFCFVLHLILCWFFAHYLSSFVIKFLNFLYHYIFPEIRIQTRNLIPHVLTLEKCYVISLAFPVYLPRLHSFHIWPLRSTPCSCWGYHCEYCPGVPQWGSPKYIFIYFVVIDLSPSVTAFCNTLFSLCHGYLPSISYQAALTSDFCLLGTLINACCLNTTVDDYKYNFFKNIKIAQKEFVRMAKFKGMLIS